METVTPDMLKRILPFLSQTDWDKTLFFTHKYFIECDLTFDDQVLFLWHLRLECELIHSEEERINLLKDLIKITKNENINA